MAVALWSPPIDLAELVQFDGANPAACTGNPACSFDWNSSAIIDYIGREPADCPLANEQASPISWVSSSTAPTFVANRTHQLLPRSQVEKGVAKLDANHVVHQFVALQTSPNSFQFDDDVWADTAAFLNAHLRLAFPDDRSTASTSPSRPGSGSRGSGAFLALGAALLMAMLAIGACLRHHRQRR